MSYWYLIPVLVVCVAFSAYFSASEIVFGAVNKIKLKRNADNGDKKAQKTLSVTDNYKESISTILVGNNLVNIAASSMATLLASEIWGADSGPTYAMLGMTVIILIFGEILPKTLSIKYSYKLSLLFTPLLLLLKSILKPIVFVVSKFVSALSKIWIPKKTEHTTDEELITIVDSIEETGGFDEKKGNLVRSAISFCDIEAYEIMIPRVDVVAMDIDDDVDVLYNDDSVYKYSRIPVYENNIDNIIGILPTKKVIRRRLRGEDVNVRELLYQPLFIHKTKYISDLLKDFKAAGTHIAVVMDEFGGTMGILTMEDILEELVGNIWDETDEVKDEFVESGDGVYTVDGDMNIYDLFDLVDYDYKDFECNYTTVGGLATEKLGGFPKNGEKFDFENLSFEILNAEPHRVLSVKVKVNDEESE